MNARRPHLKPAGGAGRRTRGRKLAGLGLRLLLPVFLLFLIIKGHAFFTVAEIRVTGAERLDRDAVIAAGGIRTGTSMFTVNGKKAARRLMELPMVKSASVTRHFPSTVAVSLAERKPAACILAGGVYWVADSEGLIFEQWPYLKESLPVVTGVCETDIAPGRVPGDQETAAALAAVLRGLESVPALEVAEFNLAHSDNLICFIADGLPVYLGSKENMEDKLILLWHSLPYLAEAGDQVAHIDVQTGDRLVLVNK